MESRYTGTQKNAATYFLALLKTHLTQNPLNTRFFTWVENNIRLKNHATQLIKEGQKHIGQMDFDTFKLASDFREPTTLSSKSRSQSCNQNTI